MKQTLKSRCLTLLSPKRWLTSQHKVLFLVVAFLMLTANHTLFSKILQLYPIQRANDAFLLSLTVFFSILTALFFLVICHGRATRWLLAGYLIIASQAAYYMDQFGVIIDTVMLDNILQTNPQELAGLLTSDLLLRTLFLGLIPAWWVFKHTPKVTSMWAESKAKLRIAALLIGLLVMTVAPFTADYAGFIREHKITRMYANPTFLTYSVIKYITLALAAKPVTTLNKTAEDAAFVQPHAKHELMILVVGETARADRFSLNGYHRNTNPMLAKQQVLSLKNVTSCGTSTGVSVPCMFSALGRQDY
ncbi:MAG TPA: phosphoethanolamine transferase domain-containing protein, partial [Methylophilus sp.]